MRLRRILSSAPTGHLLSKEGLRGVACGDDSCCKSDGRWVMCNGVQDALRATCVLAHLLGELSGACARLRGHALCESIAVGDFPYKTETSVPDPSTAYAVPLPFQGRRDTGGTSLIHVRLNSLPNSSGVNLTIVGRPWGQTKGRLVSKRSWMSSRIWRIFNGSPFLIAPRQAA